MIPHSWPPTAGWSGGWINTPPRPDQTTIEDPSLLTPVWACAKWTEEPETDGLDLIHLRLPLDRVILSDFDLFHCVLNGYGRALRGIKGDPTSLPVPRHDEDPHVYLPRRVNSEDRSIMAGFSAGVSRPLPSWLRRIWSQTPVAFPRPVWPCWRTWSPSRNQPWYQINLLVGRSGMN